VIVILQLVMAGIWLRKTIGDIPANGPDICGTA